MKYSVLLLSFAIVSKATFCQSETLRKYHPDFSAPAGAPYTAENIKIPAPAGHVLAGTLTIPRERKAIRLAVVTITGSSPQDRDHNTTDGLGDYRIFGQLADTLGRRNIAVLRMDDRGVGESTGDFWSATSPERADDIRTGIAYLRTRPELAGVRIALVGLSEGGMIAPMIAETDTSLAGIALLAGPASIGRDILEEQLRYFIMQQSDIREDRRDSAYRAGEKEFFERMETNPWLRYYWSYDPLKTARKVSAVPVYILQGKNDRNVPWTEAQRLADAFRAAGNSHVSMRIFENTNHIFLTDAVGNPDKYSTLHSFAVSNEIWDVLQTGWQHYKPAEHEPCPNSARLLLMVFGKGTNQVVDLQWFIFSSERYFPWQIICITLIANSPFTNLKFIVYENHQQRSASNTSNGIVRPVFTTNINGAG